MTGTARLVQGVRALKTRARESLRRFGPRQRSLNALIDLPRIPRRRRVPGSVWAVLMVANEADLVAHTVTHLLRQGIAGILIVDHGSADGTVEVLRQVAARDPRVLVGRNRDPGFHQGGTTSYLAHRAWQAGADWVLPVDADEHWYAEGRTLADFFAQCPEDVVWCDSRDVFPLAGDGQLQLGVGHAVSIRREPSRAPAKIAFRARRWVWVGEGNHAIQGSGEPTRPQLHLLHYQYRSLEHLTRKVAYGASTLDRAGMSPSIGAHWREQARMDAAARARRWEALVAGELDDTGEPCGPLTEVSDPSGWESWDPEGVFGSQGVTSGLGGEGP